MTSLPLMHTSPVTTRTPRGAGWRRTRPTRGTDSPPEPGFWSDPPWWFREIVLALAIGTMLLAGGWLLEGQRVERAERLEDQRTMQAQRLENLRFVRERSSEQALERPFAGMDLGSQNLFGLELSGAELLGANLAGANLTGANLTGSNLAVADLSGADLNRADLTDANLSGARLGGASVTFADVSGTDFLGADLTGADLASVCYDQRTRWPEGFDPPPPECDR